MRHGNSIAFDGLQEVRWNDRDGHRNEQVRNCAGEPGDVRKDHGMSVGRRSVVQVLEYVRNRHADQDGHVQDGRPVRRRCVRFPVHGNQAAHESGMYRSDRLHLFVERVRLDELRVSLVVALRRHADPHGDVSERTVRQ